jgi:hypothetical protein
MKSAQKFKMTNSTLSKALVLILLIGVSLTSSAQIRYEQDAVKDIRALKKGALLVRLQDRAILISQLQERGRTQEMNAVIQKNKERNLKYAKAFKQDFNFCDVYFFHASESDKFTEEGTGDVVFLDANLNPDSSIRVTAENYFFAEFITLESDPEEDQSNGLDPDQGKYKKSDMGFHALVIKDKAFQQLKRPFPFYTKTLESLPFKRSDRKVIQIMNEKLHGYLRKVGA